MRCTQTLSSHRPGPSPLLGVLKAVDLSKHVCDLVLEFLWIHVQGSAWRSGCPHNPHSACGSAAPCALPSALSDPSHAFVPSEQALNAPVCPCPSTVEGVPQGWESLYPHLTLFLACSLFPHCQPLPSVSTKSPRSTWLAASHRSMALLSLGSESLPPWLSMAT